MIGFKRWGAIALTLLVSSGCSFKKVDSRGDDANGSAFEVGSVTTVQVESLSQNVANGLTDQKAYHLKTCVTDKPSLQPRAGEAFRVRGNGLEHSMNADAAGCLYWTEKIRYQPVAPENFVELKRELVGKDGQVAISLAVNPWRDQANSLLDTRFFHSDQLGFVVPEIEAADALSGRSKYSPVDKKRGSNLSVSLISGVLEQGIKPNELLLEHAELQLKAIWPLRNGGTDSVKIKGGEFVAQIKIVERLKSNRQTAAITSAVWIDGKVTDEGRFVIPSTKLTLLGGVGDLSTFEVWYRIIPASLASGLEPAFGNILLPDGIKGRLGSVQELNPSLLEPALLDDEFKRASGGPARRDLLGFQLLKPSIQHHNSRTIAGDSKNWVRVMRIPIEVCLIDPMKGGSKPAPLVNFPIDVTVAPAAKFPDETELPADRQKKLAALKTTVNPVDENNIPVTDNQGCFIAEYVHRFHTGAKSKPELVRIEVEGRRLFKGLRRSEYIEIIILDSTRPPIYRSVSLKGNADALEVSQKPKTLGAKDIKVTFQKTTYTLDSNYQMVAHRHYRVVMEPKILRPEDNVSEAPVDQSAVALRGLLLDGSEAVSGKSVQERALAAFETHSVVDQNGTAQFEFSIPILFNRQYLLDRKTVLWFDLRASGAQEGPEPLVATVEFPSGAGDGRANPEAVDTTPRVVFNWDTNAKALTANHPKFDVPRDPTKLSYQLVAPPSRSGAAEVEQAMKNRGFTLEVKKWSEVTNPEKPSTYCRTSVSECASAPETYLRLVSFDLIDKVEAFISLNGDRNPRSEPFVIAATILNEVQYVKGDAETDRAAWKSGVDVSTKTGYGMFETGGYVRGYTNWERESGRLHEVRLSHSERKRYSITNTVQIQEESLEFAIRAQVRSCVLAYPLVHSDAPRTATLVCKEAAPKDFRDSWHYYTEYGRNPQSTLGSPFNLPSFFHVVHGATANAEFKKKMKDDVQATHFVHLKASGFELDNLKKKIDLPQAPLEFTGIINTRSLTPFRWNEDQFAQVVGSCVVRLGKRDDLKFEKKTFCFCIHEPLAQRMDFTPYIDKVKAKEQPASEYASACAARSPVPVPAPAAGGNK